MRGGPQRLPGGRQRPQAKAGLGQHRPDPRHSGQPGHPPAGVAAPVGSPAVPANGVTERTALLPSGPDTGGPGTAAVTATPLADEAAKSGGTPAGRRPSWVLLGAAGGGAGCPCAGAGLPLAAALPSVRKSRQRRAPAPPASAPGGAARPAGCPAGCPAATARRRRSIRFDRGAYRVQAPRYEAVVERDGCLTSLRLGGKEWLRCGGPIARGCYFFQQKGGGTLKLPDVKQEGNVITARGDKAAVRYQFDAGSLRWQLTNTCDAPLNYFAVLDKAVVTAVQNDKGDWAATPATKPWPAVTWYGAGTRLAMTGADNIWGPFEEQGQVWAAVLPPHQGRDVVLTVGTASAAETAQVAKLKPAQPTAPPIPPPPKLVSPLPPDPAVSVTKDQDAYRVQVPKYEATVEADGCLTSLRLGDVEFLRPGVGISRGAYFHQTTPLKPLAVTHPVANVLEARGPQASERFEFGADLLVLKLTNATAQPMSYFMVFDPAVTTVNNDKGQVARTPTKHDWPTTSWTANPAPGRHAGLPAHPLRREPDLGPVDGWIPGLGSVPDAPRDPAGDREDRLRSAALRRETALALELAGVSTPHAPGGTDRPAGRGASALRPRGSTAERPIAARSCSGQMAARGAKPGTRTVDATLPAPAGGWYRLEVRALRGKEVVAQAAVDHVGVGEVFVMAGQSNSTNCGSEKIGPKSGLVSTFSGRNWRPADDPQPGVHDHSAGGSPWPAFGDALAQKYRVPVGDRLRRTQRHQRQAVAAGGRTIQVDDGSHGPAGAARVPCRPLAPGRVRHRHARRRLHPAADRGDPGLVQGRRLGRALVRGPGFSLPERVQPKGRGRAQCREEAVGNGGGPGGTGHGRATGDNRDNNGQGIHFSAKGLHAHGVQWAAKVSAYLDKVLQK